MAQASKLSLLHLRFCASSGNLHKRLPGNPVVRVDVLFDGLVFLRLVVSFKPMTAARHVYQRLSWHSLCMQRAEMTPV